MTIRNIIASIKYRKIKIVGRGRVRKTCNFYFKKFEKTYFSAGNPRLFFTRFCVSSYK